MEIRTNLKRIIILFSDHWILYSPTVINLIKLTREMGCETITINYADQIDKKKYKNSLFSLLGFLFKGKALFIHKIIILYRALGLSRPGDIVIAVDSISYISVRLVNKNTIYLSLEVGDTRLEQFVRFFPPAYLISQSLIRAYYLIDKFPNSRIKILPNSPIFSQYIADFKRSKKFSFPLKVVYLGNVTNSQGIEEVADALISSGMDFQMVVRGLIDNLYFQSLGEKYLARERIINFFDEYIVQDEVLSYLSEFHIGFVLYNFSLVNCSFNYLTSPSGKVHNYLAAGLPVIAIDTPGNSIIRHYKCGVLIQNLTASEILAAFYEIISNYGDYSDNALRAASDYDFKKFFIDNIYPLYSKDDLINPR